MAALYLAGGRAIELSAIGWTAHVCDCTFFDPDKPFFG